MTDPSMEAMDKAMQLRPPEQTVTEDQFICACCEHRLPNACAHLLAEVWVCDDCWTQPLMRLARLVNPRYEEVCRKMKALERFHDGVYKRLHELVAAIRPDDTGADYAARWGSLKGIIEGEETTLRAHA